MLDRHRRCRREAVRRRRRHVAEQSQRTRRRVEVRRQLGLHRRKRRRHIALCLTSSSLENNVSLTLTTTMTVKRRRYSTNGTGHVVPLIPPALRNQYFVQPPVVLLRFAPAMTLEVCEPLVQRLVRAMQRPTIVIGLKHQRHGTTLR